MPTTLIFGGSGKVAGHLIKHLTTKVQPAHSILAITRSEDHTSTIEALNPPGTHLVQAVVQSIEDSSVKDLVNLLKKYSPIDNIVWAAGAGGKGDASRTDKVDRDGAIKTFDAASKAGVKRYVIVSANDVRDREKDAPEWYNDEDKKVSDKSWDAIPKYFAAKFAADKDLVSKNDERGLDFTVVRPGTLSDDMAKGTVSAGRVHLGEKVTREDVAAVIVEVLKNDKTIGLAFDVLGGDVPIPEAVKQVAEKKEDCFEGYY